MTAGAGPQPGRALMFLHCELLWARLLNPVVGLRGLSRDVSVWMPNMTCCLGKRGTSMLYPTGCGGG